MATNYAALVARTIQFNAVILSAAAIGLNQSAAADPTFYQQHNLVSDGFVSADHTDSNLVNAWGLASSPTSPWWVADNGMGVSTLYKGSGDINPLVVNVPGADGTPNGAAPTGIVFSGSADFVVSDGTFSGPSRFIFASEDGTISGWSPAVPPPPPSHQAQLAVNNSASGAIYKGLALLSTDSGNFLYATDFHNNKIDVFDGQFHAVTSPGGFHDSHIPNQFAPFGIAAIGGKLYVSYAKQDADAHDNLNGAHLGYVDVFDSNGNLLKRLIKKGKLNAPWGLAVAPANFGNFSNRLLVGNFGDGRINAYDINNGHFKGTLRSSPGHPIQIDGLWGIGFGNGADSGPTNTLYFAAGPDDEAHGLYGRIDLTLGDGNDNDRDRARR